MASVVPAQSVTSLPPRFPTTQRTVQIVGGENLYRLAELYLGDATQWWRLAAVNDFPGEQPDFIISVADAERLGGTLKIPVFNPNAVWP